MKIGLIDVDGHNFPNLPLMKISAWHKQQGDHVEWYSPMFSGHMDKVYMSKVFTFTDDYQYNIDADEIVKGVAFYGKNICDFPENVGETIVLYVDINEQRKGIGQKLISWVKNELKNEGFTDMIVWCLKDNVNSIEFYKAMGGIVMDERDFEIDDKIYKEVGIMYKL